MALETDEKLQPKEGTDKSVANKLTIKSNTKSMDTGSKKKGINNGGKKGKDITNGHNNNTTTMETKEINGNIEKDNGTVKNNDNVDKSVNNPTVTTTTTTTTTNTTTDNEKLITESDYLELYQDTGITVHIQSPNADLFSIQVSSMELVQEIHQLLMDREDTCHRTCFSLQLDGVTLDNFAELKNIEGLKDGSVIKVVEEPYTMREARIHVRHVRDLLKSMDPADAYNGVDCNSLTFLTTLTQGDLLEKKKARPDNTECTPPEYIMPGSKDRPLLPLQPGAKNPKGPQALKVLTTSAWNPPPGPRKLHGDLMYLYVITSEDKRFHISACPKGFYVNQSTDEIFNPRPDNPSHLCHSLIDMLAQISPNFKRSFSNMQKKRTFRHAFERVATPYQIYTWTAPTLDHTLDAIRAEDAFSSKLGYEEHIPGQTRDWNEELQTTRELPRKTLPDRLLRERAIFKVHGDFVIASTRGAMAVIDGNVLAINPGEDAKMQMFIWNNIFFSLGFDVRDHYKELGGDVAAFVAPRNDLHGVRVYSAVDVEGLYTLGTVVIDYRGYRVTAQSIIPGILEREQEQSVVYGSIDFGKTVLTHPKYLELLTQAGQHLKILPHFVSNEKGEDIELCSSVECKGIIGNDGRHYILDLLRTFPPDVNFLKLSDEELSDEMKKMGFPIEHKHKLCCLRQELLEAFVEDRYVQFIKYAAHHLQQINAAKKQKDDTTEDGSGEKCGNIKAIENNNDDKKTDDNNKEKDEEKEKLNNEEKLRKEKEEQIKKLTEVITEKTGVAAATASLPTVNTPDEKQAADVVKRACSAVGSLKEFEFDFRFNPDVFSPGIKHVDKPDIPACSLKKQKQLVKDAAEFLVTKQIPCFVHEHADHSSAPMDGSTLTEALHSRGINIRYMGKVIIILAKVPKLEYLYHIALQELIIRATKHIYYSYMQNTEMMSLASAISHFLNCFLTSGPVTTPNLGSDELLRTSKQQQRRNKRKPGSKNAIFGNDNNDWAVITQKSLWQHIKKEIKAYWDYDLGCDSIEQICEQFKLQRISMLRAFCLKVGIQILLREYNFESRNKTTFNDDDIVNVFPIVKHINPRASDAYNFYTTGQTKIQQGYFKEGYELISEALNLLNNVFGAMHPENAQCLRMLARLSYIMGDPQEALAIQQRAVIMSERVNGIDHPYTILEYSHLALYSFANGQVIPALKLLYRARYLALLICGENHPDIALLDSNISLILHAMQEYGPSLVFLEHALALNIKYYGKKSLKVAVSYHLVARTQSCMGDFRSALNNEKETYAIYKQQLGENHEKTQESSECLKLLTQQAVFLQKKMNDICTNGKLTSSLPPIHIQPPTWNSVLDMLNAINGILFVQISPKDIAKLRTEIEKHQKDNDTDTATETQESIKRIISAAAAKTETELTNGNINPSLTTTTTTTNNIVNDDDDADNDEEHKISLKEKQETKANDIVTVTS